MPGEKSFGYRELTAEEFELFDDVRKLEFELARKVNVLCGRMGNLSAGKARHVAMARSHLETGFMFLGKSVTQPTTGFGVLPNGPAS